MSSLILVRHGQASFFADDYDKLSPLGVEQARRLGEHSLAQQLIFDEVYCGPRVRHRDTADGVGDCYRRAGMKWPDPVILPALDEHQVDQLVMKHEDALAGQSAELKRLAAELSAAQNPAEKYRRFQRLFEAVANLWLDGHSFDVESWSDFRSRVNGAIDHIVRQNGRGRTVAVFTSVGPITVAALRALQCSEQVALQMSWRLWNCSMTEFVFSGDRFTLDRFNALPHLDRKDWTYR
jgi:broad specificity phosphatase PhoE